MTRLYVTGLSLAVGARFALPDAARAHVRARRLQEGEGLTLFDGSGREYVGSLVGLDRKEAIVEITSADVGLGFAAPELTLGLSVIAADRMDWAIQKACELGVAAIVPILAERSQAPGNAANKVLHWQAVAASAAEQCGRARVAMIEAPAKLAEALILRRYCSESAPITPQVWICERASASDPLLPDARRNIAFIGPEGGWTAPERALLQAQNARTLVLSRATLRAETAAIAATMMLLSAR